jgi:hypothetical protein
MNVLIKDLLIDVNEQKVRMMMELMLMAEDYLKVLGH